MAIFEQRERIELKRRIRESVHRLIRPFSLRLLASTEISNKVLSTQVELSQTQVELSQTQVELSQTQVELSQTQVELSQTQVELSQTQVELSQTQVELSQTQVELSQTQVELSQTQVELSQTQVELSQTQVELQALFKHMFFIGSKGKRIAGENLSTLADYDEFKVVFDKGAGMLAFPKNDKVMSEFIRKNGIWEQPEQDWISRNIRDGHLVLNIGANLGVHTIVASKFVGPKGKVIAFECHPEIIKLLAMNLSVNQIENVVMVPKAVAEFDGEGVLYCSADNSGDNRLVNSTDLGDMRYEVEVVRLETYLDGLDLTPNIVIMDIQGLELPAIRGLGNKLAQGGKILFEFTPRWMGPNLDDGENQLIDILESGHKLFMLDEFGSEIPITVDELMDKFISNLDLLYLNLVLWKE